jgi:hypothetical protein
VLLSLVLRFAPFIGGVFLSLTPVNAPLTRRDTATRIRTVERGSSGNEPLSQIPTPRGVAPYQERSSTGVCLNGFFVFHASRTPPVRSALESVARKKRPVLLDTPAVAAQPVSEGLG